MTARHTEPDYHSPRRTRHGSRKSDRVQPARFCTIAPEAVSTWGGGGPPALVGQLGSRWRVPGQLHWQKGDADSEVQLPLAKTLATSEIPNWQMTGCVHLDALREQGRAVGTQLAGRPERGGSQIPSRHEGFSGHP